MSHPAHGAQLAQGHASSSSAAAGSAPTLQHASPRASSTNATHSSLGQGPVPTSSLPAAASTAEQRVFGQMRKGAKAHGEDCCFHLALAQGKVLVAGVMDGHGGYNGMTASHVALDTLWAFFQQHSDRVQAWGVEEWQQRLRHAFALAADAIRQKFLAELTAHSGLPNDHYLDTQGVVRRSNGQPVRGGTTCTVTVVVLSPTGEEASVITANVGDSIAMLVPTWGSSSHEAASQCQYQVLTSNHTPNSVHEYTRIQSLHLTSPLRLVYDRASVKRKYECPAVFTPDGQLDPVVASDPWQFGLHPANVRMEPAMYGVTPRNVTVDATCLQMTRTLGDFYAHQFGVSSEPEISVHHVVRDRRPEQLELPLSYLLIIASDGVWDLWPYQQLVDTVVRQLQIHQGCVGRAGQHMFEGSTRRAISHFGEDHLDDAALVLLAVV